MFWSAAGVLLVVATAVLGRRGLGSSGLVAIYTKRKCNFRPLNAINGGVGRLLGLLNAC